MKRNETKGRLSENQAVFGSFAYLAEPAVVEIMARAGFDFVIIDMEHTALDMSMVEQMVRAADGAGITALVRVPENNEKTILRALETGAQGIVIPFVRTAEDAQRAYAATRYPPDGVRGMCSFSRAAQYGAVRPEYKQHELECNREILLVALIEDETGVQNARAILDAGIDVALVGRGDLSVSLGVSNEAEHPLVVAATEEVLATAAECGRWGGIITHNSQDARRWSGTRCPFICYSLDMWILMDGYMTAIDNLRSWSTTRVVA